MRPMIEKTKPVSGQKPNLANKARALRGIQFRLLLTSLSLITVLLITFTGIQIGLQKAIAQEQLEARITLIKQNLIEHGKSVSKLLVVQVENDIATYNFSELNVYLINVIQEWKSLRYAILTDLEGTAYIHTEKPELQQAILSAEQDQFAIKQQQVTFQEYPSRHIIEYITPIKFGKPWGVLRLGIGLENMEQEILKSTQEMNNRTGEILLVSVIIAIVFIVLSTVLVLIISSSISKPIISLTRFSQQLAKGDFDNAIKAYRRSNRIDITTETGLLATSFIDMANEIKTSQLELEQYSHTLEEKVKRRTEELMQSEKMASLGQLIAGIAHEINTPLGAISSSASNMQQLLVQTLPQMPILFQRFSTEQCTEFLRILNKSLASDAGLLSAKEQREKRLALTQVLADKMPEDQAANVVDTLVDMGIYDDTDMVMGLLAWDNGIDLLNLAYKLSELKKGTQTINMATERASKVVFALKSYAHPGVSGDKIEANLTEGLDNILTLYQSHIKQGVKLIKNYSANLPKLYCYPDELNQVWTNLIHNALQAMNNKGTLSVSAEQLDGQLKVSIEDSGKGIKPENLGKIFDAFYTTKAAGEGSGLGLYIIKEIIDKHFGNISVESQPGRTLFTVLLPIRLEGGDDD